MNKQRIRPRAFRNKFTINNPFLTEDVKVLDPDNLTDGQKSLLGKVTHDYAYLRQPQYGDTFVFALTEYDLKENNEIVGKAVAERAFFKDYKAACEYFKTIEFIDYFCFQYEQGKSGNKHLQGFMHYRRQVDFSTVKIIFPTIHLDRCDKSNFECRDYCLKLETKIEGCDFFEHGNLVEERERTDMPAFVEAMKNDASNIELFEKHPGIMLSRYPNVIAIRQDYKREKNMFDVRDLEITYIYGAPRAGKSTFPRRVLGYRPTKDYAKIAIYKTQQFDEYHNQKIILFDEYKGQYPLTMFNDLLDGEPRELPARFANRVACYTKVFITSNYSPDELYRRERDEEGMEISFTGLLGRITEIIYMPKRNVHVWQKGEPTAETIAEIERQGAKYSIERVERWYVECE